MFADLFCARWRIRVAAAVLTKRDFSARQSHGLNGHSVEKS
jgi:hypothetical protein